MTLCFLIPGFLKDESTPINGTLVQAYILAKGLAALGFEVHYIAASGQKSGRETVEGITVHYVPAPRNPLLSWPTYRAVRQKLKQVKPDAVYSRGRHRFTYLAGWYANRYGKRFVWATNGEDGAEPQKFLPNLWQGKRPLWRKLLLSPVFAYSDWLMRRGIRWAHACINQTGYQQKRLLYHFGKQGQIVRSAHPVPALLPKQTNPKVVLWLATVSPAKQTLLFVRLAREINVEGWEFWLVGGSNNSAYIKQVQESAEKLPHLKLFGKMPFEQTGNFFQQASLFVNTSRPGAEGLPNTFVQAWLHGTPVCSLNFDPDQALTKHQTGFYAEGDYEKLKNGLQKLMQDDKQRQQLSENARGYAVVNFDQGKIITQYAEQFTGEK